MSQNNGDTFPSQASRDDAERRKLLEQEAWRIVHEGGPAWHNSYRARFPYSKASRQRLRDECAHYCVMAALNARDASLAAANAELDAARAEILSLVAENDRLRSAAPSGELPSFVDKAREILGEQNFNVWVTHKHGRHYVLERIVSGLNAAYREGQKQAPSGDLCTEIATLRAALKRIEDVETTEHEDGTIYRGIGAGIAWNALASPQPDTDTVPEGHLQLEAWIKGKQAERVASQPDAVARGETR